MRAAVPGIDRLRGIQAPEAASAVSEFGQDEPPQSQTVSTWRRLMRAVRRWQIGRMRP
jgi:hypothetical protein